MHRLLRLLLGQPIDRRFLDAICAIRWFERCGYPAEFDVPLVVQPVWSWDEAMNACADEEREQTTLVARNAMTSFLHAHYRGRHQRWNEVTKHAKDLCVEPLKRSVWNPFAEARSLARTFVDSTSWNVLAAIMEHEYRECAGLPIFFSHLLEVYRAGHFPCGWVGTWPAGKLLYY